jgi:hypothetical protein
MDTLELGCPQRVSWVGKNQQLQGLNPGRDRPKHRIGEITAGHVRTDIDAADPKVPRRPNILVRTLLKWSADLLRNFLFLNIDLLQSRPSGNLDPVRPPLVSYLIRQK